MTETDGTTVEETGIPRVVQQIQDDPDLAMRAERTAGDPDKVDEPYTSIRYVGEKNSVPQFQVVWPKTTGFPHGQPKRHIAGLDSVADWPDGKDVELVDVEDVDLFERTEYDEDSYPEKSKA